MTILVTGAAGFIGMHLSEALLRRGERVVGVDNLNPYYDPRLKRARLARIEKHPSFRFVEMDISEEAATADLFHDEPFDRVVHLAAQAGVRYSLENPLAYVQANVQGQVVMLEAARKSGRIRHMVYASSSSVYGGNRKMPFSVKDPVEHPISVYAASKRSGELFAQSCAHLYRLPLTGLRFFTVYGPWGRPDMAAYLFAEAISSGRPIKVFNQGEMRRDFTFVADIVAGIIAALDRPPADEGGEAPHRIYNLGNNRPERLLDFIATLERHLGKQAIIDLQPLQAGDVPETYADISESERDLGFSPKTGIEDGLGQFVSWYRTYHQL